MTTVRFGTSCGPYKRITFREANPHWEDDGVLDDADQDKPVQCPFDTNHIIRTCRFAYHIQKCEKNNPELAAAMVTCPYNAQHRMLSYEMDQHVKKCINRQRVAEEFEVKVLPKFQVPVNTFSAPQSEEDWETESDNTTDTFIWGVSTHNLAPQNGCAGPKLTPTRAGPALRLPSTLPWKM
ncbi:gametocyte-specific factor 1-like [Alosa sapidissima]|uniref:gametocyte-specific factor 1-like n=1 Tax=Alosa sapidissima TaxID=34773 RepID=UPI001C0997A7|nr:gametocyte-specific factor 1-like [Alosa sapidissima]